MRKIVTQLPANTVRIADLQGNEIVAYRRMNSTYYAMLTKLVQGNTVILTKNFHGNHVKTKQDYRYGFVGLNTGASDPSFVANDWHQAIQNAVDAGRTVMVFNTQEEFFAALHGKAF